MPEAVRLVIWDLDDTFWIGTLSEGVIEYRQAHHDIVVELARRGIVSSICSKNDHAPVEQLLTERGIWDHFVFPSINWEPKGARIAALIEAVQLRAESVLLIDDNPMNRMEAQHYAPGIQVADETTILRMLDDPMFKGKDDSSLSRLEQYRLLQRRKADEASASAGSGDNHDFLRASGIRVEIDYDVAGHIDRAIELVNRTNQLNFTKNRLPEDIGLARKEMKKLIRRYNVLCGMVRVRDRYGDYGWCGFFAMKRTTRNTVALHLCFSCRVLNMGVEQWLYDYIGRPALTVVQPVSSDLTGDAVPDWIAVGGAGGEEVVTAKSLAFVGMRGSCDLRPLEHYLSTVSEEVVSELMYARHGMMIRIDHSLFLRYALKGVDPAFVEACGPLGYRPEDFRTAALESRPGGRCVHLLSLKGDVKCGLYRHNKTGFIIPMRPTPDEPVVDYTKEPLERFTCSPKAAQTIVSHLSAEFTYLGAMTEEMARDNTRIIFEAVAPQDGIVMVLPDDEDPAGYVGPSRRIYNQAVRSVAAAFPNVNFVTLTELTHSRQEKRDVDHYDRIVYYRLFQHVQEALGAASAAAGETAAIEQPEVVVPSLADEPRTGEPAKSSLMARLRRLAKVPALG